MAGGSLEAQEMTLDENGEAFVSRDFWSKGVRASAARNLNPALFMTGAQLKKLDDAVLHRDISTYKSSAQPELFRFRRHRCLLFAPFFAS
jgi:hypothetical protein